MIIVRISVMQTGWFILHKVERKLLPQRVIIHVYTHDKFKENPQLFQADN